VGAPIQPAPASRWPRTGRIAVRRSGPGTRPRSERPRAASRRRVPDHASEAWQLRTVLPNEAIPREHLNELQPSAKRGGGAGRGQERGAAGGRLQHPAAGALRPRTSLKPERKRGRAPAFTATLGDRAGCLRHGRSSFRSALRPPIRTPPARAGPRGPGTRVPGSVRRSKDAQRRKSRFVACIGPILAGLQSRRSATVWSDTVSRV